MKKIVFVCAMSMPMLAMAQSDRLLLEFGKCSTVADNTARLACYDNLARPAQDKPVAVAPAPTAPASSASKVTVVESVGIAGGAAANNATGPTSAPTAPKALAPARVDAETAKVDTFGQKPKVVANAEGEETLVAKVSAIREVELNKKQITLSNGQVWRQTIAKSLPLHENDTVCITPSGWGSEFRLEVEGQKSYIQVKRSR